MTWTHTQRDGIEISITAISSNSAKNVQRLSDAMRSGASLHFTTGERPFWEAVDVEKLMALISRQGDQIEQLRKKTTELEANTEDVAQTLEAERARVLGKLTELCSDIWDASKRYDVGTQPDGVYNEERSTLRRLLKLVEKAKLSESTVEKMNRLHRQAECHHERIRPHDRIGVGGCQLIDRCFDCGYLEETDTVSLETDFGRRPVSGVAKLPDYHGGVHIQVQRDDVDL